MFDDEIESFKNGIDLRAYAAAQGYQLDRKESWRGSAPSCVTRTATRSSSSAASDGHYVYFSVRQDDDNGIIIDFVQNRQRVSLGAVRKELRPWIGHASVAVPAFAPLHENQQGSHSGRDRIREDAGRRAPSLS